MTLAVERDVKQQINLNPVYVNIVLSATVPTCICMFCTEVPLYLPMNMLSVMAEPLPTFEGDCCNRVHLYVSV